MYLRDHALRFSIVLVFTMSIVNVSIQGAQPSGQQAGASGSQQATPQTIRDAREGAPTALIGTWVLNLSKSKLPGTPPKSEIRTFDYTTDGLLLHTYMAVTAQGNNTFGHWYGNLNGEAADYLRPSGATPFMMVALKKIDDYNIEMILKQRGVIGSKGVFTLSKDGQTLTRSMTNLTTNVTQVHVWDRQPNSQAYVGVR